MDLVNGEEMLNIYLEYLLRRCQNMIFYGLQQALFARCFDDDEEEDSFDEKKKKRIIPTA